MSRILVVSAGFSFEHANKDLGVFGELRERGHDVRHVLVGRGIPPGYPSDWVERREFATAGSIWRDRLVALVPLLAWAETVLVPNARGVNQIVRWAQCLGRCVVQHDNLGGLDYYYYDADYVALKGPYFREMVNRADHLPGDGEVEEPPAFLRPGLRALRELPENRVDVTGSVQYDRAFSADVTSVPRDEFCTRYGLDPSKSIVVWLPDGAQNQDPWSQRKYTEICTAVERSQSHSLIIKLHPNDYLGWKSDRYLTGRRSSDVLYPQGVICRPEDKYLCFRHADVALTILSSVSLELSLFKTPVVFVDSDRSPTVRNYAHFNKSGIPLPGVAGFYCASGQLTEFLDNCSYRLEEPLYDAQVEKFSLRADGKACVRVADLVERADSETQAPRLSGRLIADLGREIITYWARNRGLVSTSTPNFS